MLPRTSAMMKLFVFSFGFGFLIRGAIAFGSAPEAKLTLNKIEKGTSSSCPIVNHLRNSNKYSNTRYNNDNSPLLRRMAQMDEDSMDVRTRTFEIHDLDVRHEALSSDEQKDRTKLSLGVAFGSLAVVALAAKVNILPLPFDFVYTDASIARDIASMLLTAVLAYAFVKFVSSLAANGIMQPADSRKMIHTFSAPLFLFVFPLFTPAGRFFAACVPFINAFRLCLAASGDNSEADFANAISRTGDKKEALGGPLVYVIVMFAAVSLFWRENLIGVTALCTMAAGDGMADIVGRRWGSGNRWFFSQRKSIAGSLAFFLSASLCTTAIATWLSFTGCLELPFVMNELAFRIAAISAACAMVELLPLGDDNWNVPISAAILAAIFLQ